MSNLLRIYKRLVVETDIDTQVRRTLHRMDAAEQYLRDQAAISGAMTNEIGVVLVFKRRTDFPGMVLVPRLV